GDAAQAHGGGPLGFPDGGVDVPERQHGHGEQPALALLLPFGHGVVVDRDDGGADFGVDLLDDGVHREAHGVGVDDLGPDTHLVHDREACGRVVGGLVDVLVADAVGDVRTDHRGLLAGLVDEAAAAGHE